MPAEIVRELIHSRQTVMPKRLLSPGPNAQQIDQLFSAAAAAPDHGQITPWRFVVIEDTARKKLADVFVQALLARDSQATAEELSRAAEKAHRAPLLLLAIGKTPRGDDPINATERLLSAGCAIQNLLLMATAQGFGSALTTGKALASPLLEQLFSLSDDEIALCFISIGTAQTTWPRSGRPLVASFTGTLK